MRTRSPSNNLWDPYGEKRGGRKLLGQQSNLILGSQTRRRRTEGNRFEGNASYSANQENRTNAQDVIERTNGRPKEGVRKTGDQRQREDVNVRKNEKRPDMLLKTGAP